MKKIIFIMLIALNIPVSAQSIIEITVKGISDSKKYVHEDMTFDKQIHIAKDAILF